jgi:hypothetical protein
MITTPRTEAMTLHSSVRGVNLGGRAAIAASASCVGGGSGINDAFNFDDACIVFSMLISAGP